MDFFSCLNKAASDFISRSETNKILGFVSGVDAWMDTKDVINFMLIPLL